MTRTAEVIELSSAVTNGNLKQGGVDVNYRTTVSLSYIEANVTKSA